MYIRLPQPLAILLLLIGSLPGSFAQNPANYVNPFIGTSNYGATHPGAVLPQGMVSVSPFNAAFKKGEGNLYEKDSEWHSRPYTFENQFLTGFSHTNLSGVGCPELGSLLLMPTTGPLVFDPEKHGSTYHSEHAEPGYYHTFLEKYRVKAASTATLRAGLNQFTFPKGQSNILLNLGLGLTNESGAALRIVSANEVEGYKLIGTFCYNPEDVRPVYFVAQLSKPADSFGAYKKMPPMKGVEAEFSKYDGAYKPYEGYQHEMAGENIGAYFSYQTKPDETIAVKIGISYTSIENARKNLQAEIPAFDFIKTRKQAWQKWNDILSRIEVKGGKADDKTIFYTALYHVLMHPNILQDVDGTYPLMESYGTGNTIKNRYTTFSLWDTYRNVHPLLSLVYPDLQSNMVQSMLDMYQESGWLPKWELLGMETNVMVGDPATPVIVDTYLRGIRNFDEQLAYEAIKKGATTRALNNPLRPGINVYDSIGYLPDDPENDIWGGGVSTALEYYIADWNIAQMAKALGYKADGQFFSKRAKGYTHYFDSATGMLRPRLPNGQWLTPFNPLAGANFEPVVGYVEGNAWQYRFYVPHDITGLIRLLGGKNQFVQALQTCFDNGHYDMANEPDITYPFLFNHVPGEAWRTQKTVRSLIRKHYTNTPGGIPGNDDAGTLSAWLVYAMIGLYPHCPGDMEYAMTTPVFDEVLIQLDNGYYPGKTLRISAKKGSGQEEQAYIDKVYVNGKLYKRFFINHEVLVNGAHIEYLTKGESP